MRPVDTFLRSVRDAFNQPEDIPAWGWAIVGGLCLSSVITVSLLSRYGRRRAQKLEFARFLAERKVTTNQHALLDKLAKAGEVTAHDVATRIDVFERVTASQLAKHPPSLIDGNKGIFAEIIALRRALGFEGIAGHFAMLTTRELSAGQLVEIAGVSATVTEVTEGYFAAVAPASAMLPIGQSGSRVRVTLTRDQEARYETRCVLLAKQPGQETQRLVFGHDEHPNRIQLRKAVRVTVRGPVRLHPAHGPVGGDALAIAGEHAGDEEMELGMGSLVDISVGGAALDTAVHVPVGSSVRLSFTLDGVTYDDLLAFVLECRARHRGTFHMRVQFRNLAQSDEHRLAASVARYSAHPFTEPTAPTEPADGTT